MKVRCVVCPLRGAIAEIKIPNGGNSGILPLATTAKVGDPARRQTTHFSVTLW